MTKDQGKILYLVTQSEWGGAQVYIFDLATHFDKKGWEVVVAAGEDKDGELLQKLKKADIATYYLSHLKRKVNFYHDLLIFFDLVKLIKKVKPDIVHLNSSKAGSLGAVAAKLAGVKKIIYTVHGLVLNEPLGIHKKIFYWFSEWLSAKFKNHIICVSEFDKKSILKYKITNSKKITVIHNGIDLENLKFLTKEEARQKISDLIKYNNSKFKIQNSKFLIGTIANFYQTKGLVYLIEAAREVKQINENIKFIIIGDGRERKTLEKIIKDYKLGDTVFLLGVVENAKYYLKAFDLFVLPSIKEGLSYTLIEAQAAGVPVITTDVGGNPEIVENNKTGILVPAKNFNALAENIINLAQDKSKQAKFSSNALTSVKKFELKKMVEKTEKIYCKL